MTEAPSNSLLLGRGRPLRSLLFAPANDLRKVEKLRTSRADAVVLDLEDAVAESAKADARRAAAEALAVSSPWRAAVRVNGLRTPHFEADVEAAVAPGLSLLVVPKVEGPEDLQVADEALTRLEAERGVDAAIGVIALIESARGLASVESVALEAPARLERLVFGPLDFAADVGIEPSEAAPELLYARSRVVVAAALLGRGPALDGPYVALGDDAGLASDCERSRRLGFGGRVAIHPAQVETIHATYSLLADGEAGELAEIVAAFERALEEGSASIRVGERFVDYPVYHHARERLRLHELALAEHGGER